MRFILVLLLSIFLSFQAEAKIVYLISPPRSLSVAFTCMMHARGDFEIFNEPSQFAYNIKMFPEFAERTYTKNAYATFDEVKQALYSALEKRSVFAKEISFSSEEFLLKDPEFVQNENVQFVFLVRNPHHSAISFYKKQLSSFPELTNLLGYESLYHIFLQVERESKNKPIIIFTEDLYFHPEETVRALCCSLDIPFIPESLHWSYDETFDAETEWHESKVSGAVEHWHGEAIHSGGFTVPTQYAVDANGEPTFEEITNSLDRNFYREAYLYNLYFYNLLKNKCDYLLLNKQFLKSRCGDIRLLGNSAIGEID